MRLSSLWLVTSTCSMHQATTGKNIRDSSGGELAARIMQRGSDWSAIRTATTATSQPRLLSDWTRKRLGSINDDATRY